MHSSGDYCDRRRDLFAIAEINLFCSLYYPKQFFRLFQAVQSYQAAPKDYIKIVIVLRINLETTVADAVTCLLSLKSISFAPFSTPSRRQKFFSPSHSSDRITQPCRLKGVLVLFFHVFLRQQITLAIGHMMT